MVMPVYIAEMTPKESRGMMGSITGPTLNIGLLVAYFSNIGFERFSVGWRVSVAILASFALMFAVGMIFMPHTPRYHTLYHSDSS